MYRKEDNQESINKFFEKGEFSRSQKSLIQSILDGHWESPKGFARNVLKQGWCSKKQEIALRNILMKTKPARSYSKSYRKRVGCSLNYLDTDELGGFTGWQGEWM